MATVDHEEGDGVDAKFGGGPLVGVDRTQVLVVGQRAQDVLTVEPDLAGQVGQVVRTTRRRPSSK